MKKITVLIADNYAILRYGIRMLLEPAENISVVGEASAGKKCIELCERLEPEVCILGTNMQDMDVIQTAKSIKKLNKDIKILVFSTPLSQQNLKELLGVGISGYLLKNTSKEYILAGILSVASGSQVFYNDASALITKSFTNKKINGTYDNHYKITEREKEILSLVVQGYPSSEIADKLFISRRTVDTHRSNMMKKLDIHNTASLVRYALQNKLV